MSVVNLEQSGKLDEISLAEILRELAATEVSGSIRLASGQSKVIIYLERGAVCYAVTNLRMFRLGDCAVRWQLLSNQQLTSLNGVSNDAELVKKFTESGTFSAETISLMQKQQVTEILQTALSWTAGEWTFSPLVRLIEGVRVEIDLPNLLLEAARKMPNEFIALRFIKENDSFSLNSNPPKNRNLLPIEGFLLSRFDRILQVDEVRAVSGLPEPEVFKTLYALWLSGFLKRYNWQKAFSEEKINQILAARLTKTTKLAVHPEVQKAAFVSPVNEAKNVPLEISAEKPLPEIQRNEKRELEIYLYRIETAKSFYEVLDIRQEADLAMVKKNYFNLAKQFHPDKLHQESELYRKRIQHAFTQLAQAYETLKNAKTRELYDFKLRRDGVTSATKTLQTPQTPDEFFERGIAAYGKEQFDQATAYLNQAVQLSPAVPKFRAHYGKALAKTPKYNHQAEAELQMAVRLSGNLSEFRVMLAEFYAEVGLEKRALGDLRKILSLEPNNTAARRLLDSLQEKQ